MQKQLAWTNKARASLGPKLRLWGRDCAKDAQDATAEEVRAKAEELLNTGKYKRWIAPGKVGNRLVISINTMRFICVKAKPNTYLITASMTDKQFDRLSKRWAKAGKADAVVERGKPLRSMPFAGLQEKLNG